MTRRKSAVSKAVFSIRFVVASMRVNACASAAYGTLRDEHQRAAYRRMGTTYGVPSFQPPFRSTSFVLSIAASTLHEHG